MKHNDGLPRHEQPKGGLPALTLGALGVVFGDIGTSPLYAVNEIFFSHGALAPSSDHVLGCISLIIWALTLVVALKYLTFVMRADNDGEGGVFALYGLLYKYKRVGLAPLLFLMLLAAGLLFGDGIITPAISVLSAIEGLKVAAPGLTSFVVPITIAVLTVMFAIQRQGTARVGILFGPVIIVWFVVIAGLGTRAIFLAPGVIHALNPYHAVQFLWHADFRVSLLVLGGVMLAVTGGEALFADMGHFGRRPIRIGWFLIVYPALILNYLGQGAYLLSGQVVHEQNVFFSLVPAPLVVPMVLLATCASVIASQALISGAFSLAAQATALGLFPRLKIIHTHKDHAGQIYAPFINWALYTGCVALVWGFTASTALASAYGLAVAGDMLTTSFAMVAVAILYWRWNIAKAVIVFGLFALLDLAFLTANSLKFFEGGYIPLSIGVVIFGVMATWRWGRHATGAAYTAMSTITMGELVKLKETAETQFDRNMIIMVPKPLRKDTDNTPALFQLLWNRYRQLPKNLIFVEVVHRKTPYLYKDRYHVTPFYRDPVKGSISSVVIEFGFMEDPNVEKALESLARHKEINLPADPHHWVVHVSQENILSPARINPFAGLRLRLFSVLRQVSRPGYYYYGLGDAVQLSVEIMPVRLRAAGSKR